MHGTFGINHELLANAATPRFERALDEVAGD